ncbi:ATPase [Gardnerella sp. KA00747]|uniref:ATPase n=1 Tax=Gardnerella sp. KA00747 TaxID=2749078 RepID=UPI003BAAD7BC
MIQHISAKANKGDKRKSTILIASIVVLALILTAAGAFWYVKYTERTRAARKQCELKVAQVMRASKTWKTLINNEIVVNLSLDNTKISDELDRIIHEKTPAVVACTATSPDELGNQGAQAVAASQWYIAKATKVRSMAIKILDAAEENIKKANAADSDKQGEKKEEEKKEIQKVTGTVIRRANAVARVRSNTPPAPAPAPAPAKTGDKKEEKNKENQKNSNEGQTPPNTKLDSNLKPIKEDKNSKDDKDSKNPTKPNDKEPNKQNNQGQAPQQPSKPGGQGQNPQQPSTPGGQGQNPQKPATPPAQPAPSTDKDAKKERPDIIVDNPPVGKTNK